MLVSALSLAAAVGLVLVVVSGADPADAIDALWSGMTGSPFAIGTALNRSALLLLIGTGFVIADRAGLVNVGGEGQLAVGALGGAVVGTTMVGAVPGAVGLPLVLVAGALAGGAFAAVAAWLRHRRNTSEVITTLLMNFIGVGLVSLAVHETALLRQPVTSAATLPQSVPLAISGRLPMLSGQESPATVAVVIAATVAVAIFGVLRFTATGLRLRAAGASPDAAYRMGVAVPRLRLSAMAASGAAAGLSGAMLVATSPFVLSDGITSGLGFTGLIVGLLGRGSLLGTAAAAFGLGFLASGGVGMQVEAGVPASTVAVFQAVLVIALAGAARYLGGRR
ncbi:ABC transporter permease [Promicromonospora soli]